MTIHIKVYFYICVCVTGGGGGHYKAHNVMLVFSLTITCVYIHYINSIRKVTMTVASD